MTINFSTLVTFTGVNGGGAGPDGNLIFDAKGDLLGVTDVGGAGSFGEVFEIVNNGSVADPSYASSPTALASFSQTNGSYLSGLFIDGAGNLLGTAGAGGPGGYGVVYEIVNGGTLAAPIYANSPLVLAAFNGVNGASSVENLVADAHGDLLGVTTGLTASGTTLNDGAVFEIVNNGSVAAPNYASAPTTLVSFTDANGALPQGALVLDPHGDIFGTTYNGGTHEDGTVFEIVNTGSVADPKYASAVTTLIKFDAIDGSYPNGALVFDAHGDIFGVTAGGGANDTGVIFELANHGTAAVPNYTGGPTVLASFPSSVGLGDGSSNSGLTIDAHGDLFGVTYTGGAASDGMVFELVNNGTAAAPRYAGAITTLLSFNPGTGEYPQGGLFADISGDLFGTTLVGGTVGGVAGTGEGTVFEITNSGYVPGLAVASATAAVDDGAPEAGIGHVIAITLHTNVSATVTGAPVLDLNDGEVATYASGSGTNTLTYDYVVQAGDNVADLQVTGLGLPSGATIHDANGVNLLTAINADLGLQIITTVTNLNSSEDHLVYLMYQASFDRMPDYAGFEYWAAQADAHQLTALQLADIFMASSEFTAKFGANPSNDAFVTELYTNVLGRTADTSGLTYWEGQAAIQPRDQLLVDFATSAENLQTTAAHTTNGYWVT